MKQQITTEEITKIQNLCFSNPAKACAIAQLIVDTCQIVSCSTFAKFKNKSKRTILYKSKNSSGVKIENRKFISLNQ